MMANPTMSLRQRDKVDDSWDIVLLKLMNLNIWKRTKLIEIEDYSTLQLLRVS